MLLTVYHEHLEYYSLSSLEYLLSSFGLELIDWMLEKTLMREVEDFYN